MILRDLDNNDSAVKLTDDQEQLLLDLLDCDGTDTVILRLTVGANDDPEQIEVKRYESFYLNYS